MNITAFIRILFFISLFGSCATAQLVIDLMEDNTSNSDNIQNHKTRRSLQPSFDANHIKNLLNLQSITVRHKKKQYQSLFEQSEGGQEKVIEKITKYLQYGSRTGPSLYKKESNIEEVTYWHGLAEEGFGFASFTKRGNYSAATFSTSQEVYSFSTLHDGSHIMHVMEWGDMALRDPLIELHYNRTTSGSTTTFRKKDEDRRSLLRAIPTTAKMNQKSQEEASFQFSLQKMKDKYNKKWHNKQRNLADTIEINILVIATQQATCVVAGRSRSCTFPNQKPIKTKIENNLEVLNNAVEVVSSPVEFNMVRFNISGFPGKSIEDVHEDSKTEVWITNLANEVGADLIMIIMDPKDSKKVVNGDLVEIGGITQPNGAYSAMNSAYLDLYQFSYNVGRNIGCRPQREYFTNKQRQPPNTFNYAYEEKDDTESYFRTIMGLACQQQPHDKCPIVPFFSTKDFQIYFEDFNKNVNLGSSIQNNARYIKENGQKTADRRTTPTPVIPDDICFSPSNTVTVLGKGLINIEELKIGDYVQDIHSKKSKQQQEHYTRVYSFAKLDHNIERQYLQFQFIDDEILPLEISLQHLVFVVPKGKKQQHLVRAEDVQVGDIFHYNKQKQQQEMTVKSITTILRRGAYAPITESGTILVSGIPASSYSARMGYNQWFQHVLAHMLLSPLRLICHFNFDFCANETYNNGISEYYWNVLQFFLYLRSNYSPKMQLAWTMIGVPAMVFAYLTEQLIYNPMLGVIMVFVTIIIKGSFRRKQKTKLD